MTCGVVQSCNSSSSVFQINTPRLHTPDCQQMASGSWDGILCVRVCEWNRLGNAVKSSLLAALIYLSHQYLSMLTDLTTVESCAHSIPTFTLLCLMTVTCQWYMPLCPLLQSYFANRSWMMGKGSCEGNLWQRAQWCQWKLQDFAVVSQIVTT